VLSCKDGDRNLAVDERIDGASREDWTFTRETSEASESSMLRKEPLPDDPVCEQLVEALSTKKLVEDDEHGVGVGVPSFCTQFLKVCRTSACNFCTSARRAGGQMCDPVGEGEGCDLDISSFRNVSVRSCNSSTSVSTLSTARGMSASW